jgi:hypothetical protein
MHIADNDGLNFRLITTVWQNRARLGKFSVPSCPVNQGDAPVPRRKGGDAFSQTEFSGFELNVFQGFKIRSPSSCYT